MASDHGAKTAAGAGDRRKIVLLVLLVLFTIIFLYLQKGSPKFSKAGGAKKATGPSASAAHDPVLMMDKLKAQPRIENEGRRNLFAFAAPPAPRIARVEAAEAVQKEPDPVCGDSICNGTENHESCPSDCQPPPPPEIALKYIGYLSRPEGAVVFLTDGKEVYMGKENDIIANKYRVLKITDESVELGYLDLDQSRTIPFAGNQGG